MIGECSRPNQELKLFLECFAKQGGIPEMGFSQFLMEKLLHLWRDSSGLTWWALIGQSRDPTRFKTGQIVVNRLVVPAEMIRELGNTPPQSVKPQDAHPKANLRMSVWTDLKLPEQLISGWRNLNTTGGTGHI